MLGGQGPVPPVQAATRGDGAVPAVTQGCSQAPRALDLAPPAERISPALSPPVSAPLPSEPPWEP